MKWSKRKKITVISVLCLIVPLVIAQPVVAEENDFSLFDILFGPIIRAEKWVVNFLDDQIYNSVSYTPTLNEKPVAVVWQVIWGFVVASLGIILCGIGIMYMLAPVAEERWKYRQMLTTLGIAFIVAASSLIIANFSVDLNNALCGYVKESVKNELDANTTLNTTGAWNALVEGIVSNTTRDAATLLFFPLIILLQVGVLILCGLRILMIFFLGALLPLSVVLWGFHPTRQWGRRLTIMFFEWVFLGFFMTVALTLTIAVKDSGVVIGNNPALQLFLILAGYILLIMMPRIISVAGQAMAMASTGIGYMPVRQGMYTLGMALGTTPMLAIPKFALKTAKYTPIGIAGKTVGKAAVEKGRVVAKSTADKLLNSRIAQQITAKATKFKEFMDEPILGKSKVAGKVTQGPQRALADIERDRRIKENWDKIVAMVIEHRVKTGKIKPEDVM